MTRPTRPSLLASAFCLLPFLFAGCGYSSNSTSGSSGYHWSSLYRQDVQTVHIPIFKNVTFNRGMEFALSRAVIQKLETMTPYKIASADTADTILEGEIIAVQTSFLSQDPRSTLPQEKMMTVTLNYLWKDLRTGRVLAQRRSFEQQVTYFPTLGESSFVGSQDAVERLALAIVHDLKADW
jgi:hypothetical protein